MTSPDVTVTVCGNLTADPELRFTESGAAVAVFTVAHTPRQRQGDEWVDGKPVFLPCEVWQHQAENIGNSLSKGDRVVAAGVLRLDQWTDKETGQPRQRLKLLVTELGASMRYATVKISKATRTRAGAVPVDPYTGEPATERTAPAPANASTNAPVNA
jgi:single-strand DNA-binding protein